MLIRAAIVFFLLSLEPPQATKPILHFFHIAAGQCDLAERSQFSELRFRIDFLDGLRRRIWFQASCIGHCNTPNLRVHINTNVLTRPGSAYASSQVSICRLHHIVKFPDEPFSIAKLTNPSIGLRVAFNHERLAIVSALINPLAIAENSTPVFHGARSRELFRAAHLGLFVSVSKQIVTEPSGRV